MHFESDKADDDDGTLRGPALPRNHNRASVAGGRFSASINSARLHGFDVVLASPKPHSTPSVSE